MKVTTAEQSQKLSDARPTFPVSVDYRRTLPEMIAVGHYDWTNSDITAEHFPTTGEGKKSVEVTLFHFDRLITSEDAIREMEQADYRPAKIEELLALGTTKPNLQREFPIIALGSRWRRSRGDRRVPALGGWLGGRKFGLYWFRDEWDEQCRFVAVRK